jgi:hypothetical protein
VLKIGVYKDKILNEELIIKIKGEKWKY